MLSTLNTPPAITVGLFDLNPPSECPPEGVAKRSEREDHADFLDIPGLRSAPAINKQKSLRKVRAEQIKIPTYPDCGCPVKAVKAHTPFVMKNVLDEPRARKSVIVDIKRWRWMCKTCGKTVTQPLDVMTEDHYRMTRPLLEYCEEQALLGPELSLAKETGISPRTIRSIRQKKVARLKDEVQFATPRVLGLDGVRADNRRRRVILTNIEAGEVVDLLKLGNKEAIAERIEQFPGFEGIAIVTIDMCKTLLAAVLKALPDAVIIIDGFHIMRTGNQAMDKVRNRLFPRNKKKREPGRPYRPRPEPFRRRRATLTGRDKKYMRFWFDQQPELKLAYDLKEDYLEMFDEETYGGRELMSKAKAEQYYRDWENRLPVEEKYKDLLKDFKPILSPMKNWGEYVFNRFDHNFTNAYTESMNRKIKDILREARGCKFDTLHAKIVFGTRLRKEKEVDREAEMRAIRPRSKRRGQASTKGQRAAAGKTTKGKQSAAYELPDLSQIAFEFVN
jgi:transposase